MKILDKFKGYLLSTVSRPYMFLTERKLADHRIVLSSSSSLLQATSWDMAQKTKYAGRKRRQQFY